MSPRARRSIRHVHALLGSACALVAFGALGDAAKVLRVGVVGEPPFVVAPAPAPRGLSVDVWEAIATRANVEYEWVAVDSVQSAIDKVSAGELDVAVGPLSITSERARKVSFTLPYYQSSLAILARPKGPGAWERIRPFLSRAFAIGLGGLMLVLTIVGALVWLAERKANAAQFPGDPVGGIATGVWLALVTMTTTGYGDKVPVTLAGRIITGAWMLISLLTASSLTASIATALTLSQLDRAAIASADELARRRVATVAASTSAAFARRHQARVEEVSDLETAVSRLLDDKADAVVFDRPMLQHYLRNTPGLEVVLSEASYDPQGYGFAVGREQPLLRELNVALLELAEANRLRPIERDWLGN